METLSYPIAIINKIPEDVEFIDIDLVQKKIYRKKDEWSTISLVQVLDNGIWSLEALFQTRYGEAIGIVRDSYDIPAKAGYWSSPHTDHIAAFGGGIHTYPVYYKGKGTKGNALFDYNQILRLEFDSFKGTLILFIDNVQQPVYFSGIKEKVRFIASIKIEQYKLHAEVTKVEDAKFLAITCDETEFNSLMTIDAPYGEIQSQSDSECEHCTKCHVVVDCQPMIKLELNMSGTAKKSLQNYNPSSRIRQYHLLVLENQQYMLCNTISIGGIVDSSCIPNTKQPEDITKCEDKSVPLVYLKQSAIGRFYKSDSATVKQLLLRFGVVHIQEGLIIGWEGSK
ncbi:MAG: hypothetical protein EZS28_024525 [Streblomastix strix]|uniref:Uncharacterized protein n=1 Tax=Streblomastix strix TaxID=222440 RepID=A0A5J4VBQ6_9EUKA|nr:MAG: hypothetical protein EZS28_024525 [Streblomastix strix]